MTWVTWRQQRTETLVAFALLVLLGALLIPTGLHMASTYRHDGLAACATTNTSGCQHAIGTFTTRFGDLGSLLSWFNLIPGLIGVLLAAPLILELESGTYRLAWTQSITRRSWLAGKLGLTVAAGLLAMLAMTALMTWWRAPLDELNGRIAPNSFDFEGTVGFAYVLFAIGVTLAVGVLWRRAVPALMGGFVVYAVARVFVQRVVRQHYEAPLTSTWPASTHGPDLNRAWVLNFGPTHAVYQPAGRFWLFQGIETALFGAIGVALILFAAWWINERTT